MSKSRRFLFVPFILLGTMMLMSTSTFNPVSFNSTTFAQTPSRAIQSANPGPTIDGPLTGERRTQILLTVKGKVTDPKFECYPINRDWFPTRSLDNTIIIMFYPRKVGEYTFIVADNEAGKTTLNHFVTKIVMDPDEPDVPVPPKPIPPDGKGPFTDRLLPFYKVSPNGAAKKELAEIYSAMATTVDSYATVATAEVALAKHTSDEFKNNELRSVRDEAAKILLEKMKWQKSAPFDQEKKAIFIATFNDLSKSLLAIPD